MNFAEKNRAKITQMHQEGYSSYQIAEELNTNSSKILRAIRYLGLPRRSYSESQKLALEHGRSKHPTKGKKLSQDHKLAVSEGKAKYWANLTKEELDEISQMGKEQWEALSEEHKAEMRRKAGDAVREAAKIGSKTERAVWKALVEDGWSISFHDKQMIGDTQLEVDMYIRDLKTAIEIDGPAHFLPIWGEQSLKRHQEGDAKKTGLLLSKGFCLIRVKQMTKTLSQAKLREVINRIKEEVKKVAEEFPEDRLIEIEV